MYEKVKYLYPAKNGRWKYLRDVPVSLQGVLGRKRWDFSLGSNRLEALKQWGQLNQEHDRLIETLSDASKREDFVADNARLDAEVYTDILANYETDLRVAFNGSEIAVGEDIEKPASEGWITLQGTYAENSPEDTLWLKENGYPVKESSSEAELYPNRDIWRQTEDILSNTETTSDKRAFERLAHFATVAFGDTSFLDVTSDFAKFAIEVAQPKRPDGASGMMYDAMREAVRQRLQELSPSVRPNAPDRLSVYYREVYAPHKGHRELTQIDYQKKLADFIKDVGDLRIGDIEREHLRKYRDSLSKRMKEVSSVVGYMVPINALLNHAFSEEQIPTNPAYGLKMPTDPKTVEDRKYLPFSPNDVRQILDMTNDVWADENAKSRLSLEKRRLYRLTVLALLHTGMRPHELWKLTPDDVGTFEANNWIKRGINIQRTKSGKRLIPCPEMALPFMDLVREGGLEFLDVKSDRDLINRIKSMSGERQFGKILTELKIKRPRVSLYSTRATFVTALQRNGHTDTMIQNIIGHKGTARMLRHYKAPEEMADMLAAMESVKY